MGEVVGFPRENSGATGEGDYSDLSNVYYLQYYRRRKIYSRGGPLPRVNYFIMREEARRFFERFGVSSKISVVKKSAEKTLLSFTAISVVRLAVDIFCVI